MAERRKGEEATVRAAHRLHDGLIRQARSKGIAIVQHRPPPRAGAVPSAQGPLHSVHLDPSSRFADPTRHERSHSGARVLIANSQCQGVPVSSRTLARPTTAANL